jgi:hypothetical protein
MDIQLATLINPIFTPEAPVVIQTAGAFLIPGKSPLEVKPPEFTVFATLSGYERSDGGPITTLFARCCRDCRWPRLSLRYALTTDPRVITDAYIALARQGRLYRCPGCGASDITPPRQSGETHRCGYCNRIVELANVHGSEMSKAYEAYLRQRSPTELIVSRSAAFRRR